jgi:hypothetical protein
MDIEPLSVHWRNSRGLAQNDSIVDVTAETGSDTENATLGIASVLR